MLAELAIGARANCEPPHPHEKIHGAPARSASLRADGVGGGLVGPQRQLQQPVPQCLEDGKTRWAAG
jgi:hypothetical protein